MTSALAAAPLSFSIPPSLHATEPPEAAGRERDDVRLLVARPGRFEHVRFRDLPAQLAPGDLLVVNTSATRPAAVDGVRPDGSGAVVHFSTPAGGSGWIVELRAPDGSRGATASGDVVLLPGGARIDVLDGHPDPGARESRLWSARLSADVPGGEYLERYGRPISYDYVSRRWPLSAYQTVFATVPGSAEMPSAARPFTARLVTQLVSRGVVVAPLVLHCGVSSPEAGEPPQEEAYEVPPATARLVNETKRAGGRVIAVGTTVTRALETAARRDGTVEPRAGVTALVLDASRPARVVDGLVTGWHPPGASHLSLLEAVAGSDLVGRAYEAALAHRYLWHEFGDSCLLLPRPRPAGRAARAA
ncbi:MAG TPA: S-adenosylmethionine:tRNA ribosyltransferase-isomerase [Actinomycetota bacterium]|nr:S-adenosylmethionine:tRNA ribosyltransferase-isomerase [Actinomycetota bacterium]